MRQSARLRERLKGRPLLALKMEEGDYKPRNVEKHLESRKGFPLGLADALVLGLILRT